jgi:hypothetical protein
VKERRAAKLVSRLKSRLLNFFVRNTAIPTQPNSQHNCGHTFAWRGVRGNMGGPTVKISCRAYSQA